MQLVHVLVLLGLVAARSGWAATTNFLEGFEAGLSGWSTGNDDPAGPAAYWGQVDASFGGEGTRSGNYKAYCAGVGYVGMSDSPSYPESMLAYLSRPMDLSGYGTATLTFWHKLPGIERGYDLARVLVNGAEIWSTDQPQLAWQLVTLSLDEFVGASNLLIFEFSSDAWVTYEGWYLDDITVTDLHTPPPAPVNDEFGAAAVLIGASGSVEGTTRAATAEPGEPESGPSIWFAWSPYTNGTVTFEATGHDAPLTLCAYAGDSLATLTAIACDRRPDTNGPATISFPVGAGAAYRLSVRGTGQEQGRVTLRWEEPDGFGAALLPDLTVWASEEEGYLYGWYVDTREITQPGRTLLRVSIATPNTGDGPLELRGSEDSPDIFQRVFRADGGWSDSYAGAFTFHPQHGHLHVDDWLRLDLREVSTNGEPGEPVAGGSKTSFAVIDVQAFDLSRPDASPRARYQGGLIQGISVGWADVYEAALPDQWLDVTGVPSGRYFLEATVDPEDHIRERDEGNNVTRILIDLVQPADVDRRPANDDFANASVLEGYTAGAVGQSKEATLEPGEPEHAVGGGGGASVWWRWTAPSDMPVVLFTGGSTFATVLAVYTGSTVSNLTLVAAGDGSGVGNAGRVGFDAVAATTYWIAVDGYEGVGGFILLQLNPAWNDAFTNCVVVEGVDGTVMGGSRGATSEAGEPTHAEGSATNSLWYCWTAPVDGPVSFDTAGSTFVAVLAVYRGSSLDSLAPVAGNDTGQVSFPATRGTTYRIAIVGRLGASGVVRLHWAGPAPPRILAPPASTNVMAGGVVIFRVGVGGLGPFTFQWRHAGTNLFDNDAVSGTATETCRLSKARLSDGGTYEVAIRNAYGAVTSAPASLIVIDNPRVIYLPETAGVIGGVVALPVILRGTGSEAGVQFSLHFDPALLQNARVTATLPGSSVVVASNLVSSGRLGASVRLLPGFNVPPGQDVELLRVCFEVSEGAPDGGEASVGFVDVPTARAVSTANNLPLVALFAPGLIHLHSVQERITALQPTEGTLQLRIQGRPGRAYGVEASDNLDLWDTVQTATLGPEGTALVTDPGGAQQAHRFYRMKLLPR